MIDNLGPPWKVGKCEGCGTEIETMPGERYVGSIDGRLWHLGCSPRTIEAQPRSPVEDALGAFLVWADRVQADGGDHYLNGEKPPFGNGDDAWDDLDALRDGARKALAQSPAIDPRVEELRGALAKCQARLLAHSDRMTLDIQAIDAADTALAAFGGKTDSPKPDQLSDKEG